MEQEGPASHVPTAWDLWLGSPGPQADVGVLRGGMAQGLSLGQRSGCPDPPGAVLQDLVDGCQQSVREHCTFSHKLLELRQWIAVVTQKLESHLGDTGLWDAQAQEAEVEVRWLSSQRC